MHFHCIIVNYLIISAVICAVLVSDHAWDSSLFSTTVG